MGIKTFRPLWIKGAIVGGASIAIVIGLNIWVSKAKEATAGVEKSRYISKTTEGLREVETAITEQSAQGLAALIYKRSGHLLGEPLQAKLAALETQSKSQSSTKITALQLSNTLATVLYNRLSQLSDQELLTGLESLRGFNASDLPEKFKPRAIVRIRASKIDSVATDKLLAELKNARTRAAQNDPILRQLMNNFVQQEIEKKIGLFSEALPEKYAAQDSSLNIKLSPCQAILLTYCVISDDALQGTQLQLRERMKATQENLTKLFGSYPSPDNYYAFGSNGYIHSSPLAVLLDDTTITTILENIEAGLR